jgi:hypothetical protein
MFRCACQKERYGVEKLTSFFGAFAKSEKRLLAPSRLWVRVKYLDGF